MPCNHNSFLHIIIFLIDIVGESVKLLFSVWVSFGFDDLWRIDVIDRTPLMPNFLSTYANLPGPAKPKKANWLGWAFRQK